jgi:predicted ATPase/class 3 adenylate cyclase
MYADIEGSTQLAQQFPEAMPDLLRSHHAILRDSIEMNGGFVFQIVGDAFCAAFDSAISALNASITAQHRLNEYAWAPAPIRVRMGITTGAAQPGMIDDSAGGYSGYSTLARAQRIMSAAYGGQILLSQSSADLILPELQGEITLREMGMHRFKGFPQSERLWQVIVPDLPHDFPPLPTAAAVPNNLPFQVTSFVGRELEIPELKELLATANLLTLTGAGGTGKTRLSLELAGAVLDSFQDGVWLVEFASISDVSLLPITVARVLGLHEEQCRPLNKTILEYLQGKQLLLVLDNCEHLVEACAQFAHSVIHSCREARILSTSREPLGISGERVWQVTTLPTPDPKVTHSMKEIEGYASIQLFLERARYLLPAFQMTAANAIPVTTICYQLDGIPLAIELAAARVNQLGVEEIAGRLDDRFRLLSSGSRTALPRQQTLRALIDWGYTLLSDAEKVLLRRLSIFSGGWTLDAAEVVCTGGDIPKDRILDSLTRLVDKSMVTTVEKGNAIRYGMLETIRQYAVEKLIESVEHETLALNHALHFTRVAEEIEPRLTGADRAIWLDRLDREHENVRTALDWCARSRSPEGLRLAGAMWRFWLARGHWTEGRRWLSQMLETFRDEETAPRAKAFLGAGALAFNQRDHDAAIDLLNQSSSLSGGWRMIGASRSRRQPCSDTA